MSYQGETSHEPQRTQGLPHQPRHDRSAQGSRHVLSHPRQARREDAPQRGPGTLHPVPRRIAPSCGPSARGCAPSARAEEGGAEGREGREDFGGDSASDRADPGHQARAHPARQVRPLPQARRRGEVAVLIWYLLPGVLLAVGLVWLNRKYFFRSRDEGRDRWKR